MNELGFTVRQHNKVILLQKQTFLVNFKTCVFVKNRKFSSIVRCLQGAEEVVALFVSLTRNRLNTITKKFLML